MLYIVSWIFYISIIIITLLFTLLNSEFVTVKYYFGSCDMPLSMVSIGFLSVGIVFGFFTSLLKLIGLKIENRTLKKRLTQANIENNKLKIGA